MPRHKPGPKKKAGERYPSGKLRPRDPRGSAALNRLKQVSDAFEGAINTLVEPVVGTVLGELRLKGVLTDLEVATGLAVAETYGRYERMTAKPSRSAQSPNYEHSWSTALDPYARGDETMISSYERAVRRVTKRFNRLQDRLPADVLLARDMRDVVEQVCVSNLRVATSKEADLKAALAGMAPLFFNLRPAERSKRKVRADARVLATSLVEAAIKSLKENFGADAVQFSIVKDAAKKEHGLLVFGDHSGRAVHRGVMLKAFKEPLLTAELDAQLLKAAQAKGLVERTAP